MEIMLLAPAIKDYIWGGDRLITRFNKVPKADRIAECWELSLHPDGLSVVDSGKHKGKALKDVLAHYGERAVGHSAAKFEMFPQLIKLIDAKQSLSIQVHPSDEYALKNEGQYGKTEAWYIIDAEEGAGIYWGFKSEISREEFARRIEDNTLCEALQFVQASRGEVYFIEAGTIHAICKGLTLAEIQQNSNVTYRVYDYNRRDAEGKPRQLHIDRALDVTVTAPPTHKRLDASTVKSRVIASDKYFLVEEHNAADDLTLNADESSFNALVFIQGSGEIRWGSNALPYNKGQTFFVPAGMGDYLVSPSSKTTLLVSKLPKE